MCFLHYSLLLFDHRLDAALSREIERESEAELVYNQSMTICSATLSPSIHLLQHLLVPYQPNGQMLHVVEGNPIPVAPA